MRETSAGINKMIRKLNYEKELLISREEQDSFYTYAEGEQKVIPDYSLDDVQGRIEEIDGKIVHLKHTVNLFNSSYRMTSGMTIDQGLVKMAQLENRRRTLERMATASQRHRIWMKNGGRTEYKCANYDVVRAHKILQNIVSEIETIQLELDCISNTVLIDVADVANRE